MPIRPGTRVGPYEVTALLGEGGMGQVWRARHTGLKRDDALKVLPDAFTSDLERLARFRREAQVLASLNHPNIAHVYGLEQADGVQALVLELVEGPTLADRIAQGAIPVDAALPIAKQIAEALEAAHERGVIHRDLKPANVKLRPDGIVKVLDFGLAKLVETSAAGAATGDDVATYSPTLSLAATRAGVILGTAAYMSPEQARGQAVDKRADIWAFGCVLYEMLTGQVVFPGKTIPDTIAAVLERDPNWTALPAATLPSIRRLLERCLEKDPKRRLRDIGDARIELEDVRAGASLEVPSPQRRRSRATWIGVTTGLVVACIAIAALALRRQPVNLRPVRLSVVAPQGTTFTKRDITEHPQFALSPDGSRLAFVAAAPGERSRIWVRSLESGAAQPLADTEDGSGPFWAPDGQSLAFLARGKLKKLSLGGAAPQDLADVAFDVSQGAWSPEGVIVFSGGSGGALSRVPAGGGPVTPVTTLDPTRNETVHRWPQFLPDGRRFIVFVGSTTPAHAGVYFGSLDSDSKTKILSVGTNAIYAEPGYLLFEQNGVLTRQAFDPRSGALTGQPEATGDPIFGLRGPSYLPLSAARNGTLAYWSAPLTPTELQWFDRNGKLLGTIGGLARHESPALSPDDTKVLATLRENPNLNDIWRFDLSTGGSSRLTFTRGVARFGIWAPDSQNFAFSAANQEGPQIFQKAASGAGQEARIAGPGRHYAVFPDDWSRDARWLIYVVTSQTAFDVWALNIEDQKAEPILQTPANEAQPRLSPNGLWLAYASDESGTWEIYVQGFGGTRGKAQVSTAGGSQPAWRGDGKELFYVGPDGRLFAVPASGDRTFEAGPPRPLFQTALPPMLAPFRTGYAVSADGQRFLVNSLRPNSESSAITVVLNWAAAVRRQ
jgi:Tol biopolymer transport system component/tRNA A-37 threonylcarbamoyl transferase component Bud32